MEMFKIMKGRDKISEDELFNRVDSDRTSSTAAQQTNCSTFHKSTKIGTYVD